MKRIAVFFCLLLSALSFVSAQASKDFGVIVVYFIQGSGRVDVKINKDIVFTIGKESVYQLKYYSEGKVNIYARHRTMDEETDSYAINLKHGDTFFFRVKSTTLTGSDVELIQKTSEEANAEIEEAGGEEELYYYDEEEDTEDPFVHKRREQTTQKAANNKGTVISLGGEGFLLTSFNQVNNKSKIHIKGVKGYKHALFPALAGKADTANDLVILQLADKVIVDSIPFATRKTPVETGEKVYLVGYGDLGEIKLAEGLVAATVGTGGEDNMFQVSMELEKPYNGAPVIDKDGYLVGILSKGKKGTASIIKSTHLEELFAKSGVILGSKNRLAGKTLVEQVKILERYIYLIETE